MMVTKEEWKQSPSHKLALEFKSGEGATDGKPRGGKVVFKASDGEICVIDILQAGK